MKTAYKMMISAAINSNSTGDHLLNHCETEHVMRKALECIVGTHRHYAFQSFVPKQKLDCRGARYLSIAPSNRYVGCCKKLNYSPTRGALSRECVDYLFNLIGTALREHSRSVRTM